MNTGNNLVYLIVSAFLGLMGISGFFGRRNLSALEISVDFPEEIFAAAPLPVKITLANRRKILPAFLIKVIIDNKELLFPFVPPGGIDLRYADFFFPSRGSYVIRLIYLSSVYPFNFFTRYKSVAGTYATVVFPQIKKCEQPCMTEKFSGQAGELSLNKSGSDGEIVSVRNYASGDPSKYIHWKSSAKTGELKTKEFSTASNQPVIIDFSQIAMRDDEEKISCITYLILKSYRNNIPVGLKIDDNFYEPGLSKTHKMKMLRELALYGDPQAAYTN